MLAQALGGGMGTSGVYGTLTYWSLADVFCELIRLGMTQQDVLCDAGAGLGGCVHACYIPLAMRARMRHIQSQCDHIVITL